MKNNRQLIRVLLVQYYINVILFVCFNVCCTFCATICYAIVPIKSSSNINGIIFLSGEQHALY